MRFKRNKEKCINGGNKTNISWNGAKTFSYNKNTYSIFCKPKFIIKIAAVLKRVKPPTNFKTKIKKDL
ncbi:hypothetical protein BTO06_10450 [Tenacibaculum sp. SZ-18]|nr:hypothetical protein BTO06_10450 [Tenacibaculum sp. SZ-18]